MTNVQQLTDKLSHCARITMTCISIHGYTKYWIRFVDSLWGFGHDLLDPGRFLLGWGCLDSLATLPPAMLAEMSMSTGKALPRDAGCEGELIGTTRENYLSLPMCCKPERHFVEIFIVMCSFNFLGVRQIHCLQRNLRCALFSCHNEWYNEIGCSPNRGSAGSGPMCARGLRCQILITVSAIR